ncbi:MAG TPA: hypothetical protein VG895_03665 [Patescibacteria group bacterium]|nr:hypothetical protein [Patescibacteria group bacterium]
MKQLGKNNSYFIKEKTKTHKIIGVICIVLTIIILKDVARQLQTLNNY